MSIVKKWTLPWRAIVSVKVLSILSVNFGASISALSNVFSPALRYLYVTGLSMNGMAWKPYNILLLFCEWCKYRLKEVSAEQLLLWNLEAYLYNNFWVTGLWCLKKMNKFLVALKFYNGNEKSKRLLRALIIMKFESRFNRTFYSKSTVFLTPHQFRLHYMLLSIGIGSVCSVLS